jgi:hypothetical protein
MQEHLRPARVAIAPRLVVLSAALVLASCDGSSERGDAPGPTATSPVITAVSPPASRGSAVPPPEPPDQPPPRRGAPSASCVDGWVMPPEGDELHDVALRVLRNATAWRGTFVVTDMRYFTGPESPPSPDKGYLRVVERWYVKGYMRNDPSLQGRFLLERRRFGAGLAAVAPYASRGWGSPDWIGFQHDTADPAPRAYPGLPGTWSGIPYDFVKGGEGVRFPGLPADVTGCLDGT